MWALPSWLPRPYNTAFVLYVCLQHFKMKATINLYILVY